MNELDQVALKQINKWLELEGRSLDTIDIEEKYVRCLYLSYVYGLGNPELVRYLDTPLRERIGLQADLSQTTLWRKRTELEEHDEAALAAIQRAAKRAVYNQCLAGEPVPKKAMEAHDIPDSATIAPDEIPREIQREAARSWARLFLNRMLAPLTFGRREPSYEYRRYVGLCVHCALQDIAPNEAIQTADYLYDGDKIPSGGSLYRNINQLLTGEFSDEKINALQKIRRQFASCYDRFFAEAERLGVLSESEFFAADVTKFPTTSVKEEEDSPLTGGSGSGRAPAKYGTNSWSFQFVATVSSGAPFVRLIEPIFHGGEMQDRLNDQLEHVVMDSATDVALLACDKGYYKRDVVDVCQNHLDGQWIICGKIGRDMEQLVEDAPAGETRTRDKVNIGDPPVEPKPSAFAYPNTTEAETKDFQSVLNGFLSEERTTSDWEPYLNAEYDQSHIAYVTGLELTDEVMRKIHVLYQQRAAIESIIGQHRETHLAYTESAQPAVRLYLVNIAGLFYNMHQLARRALSPTGVPLELSGKEMLTAIRDVAFS